MNSLYPPTRRINPASLFPARPIYDFRPEATETPHATLAAALAGVPDIPDERYFHADVPTRHP